MNFWVVTRSLLALSPRWKRRDWLRGWVLGAAALLAAGCAAAPVQEGRALPAGPGSARAEVEAVRFGFLPGRILVRAGTNLRMRVRNTSFIAHNLTVLLPDGRMAKSVDVEGGKTAEFGFRVPQAGRYTIYCDKFLHRTFGMEGVIVAR